MKKTFVLAVLATMGQRLPLSRYHDLRPTELVPSNTTPIAAISCTPIVASMSPHCMTLMITDLATLHDKEKGCFSLVHRQIY